LKLSSAFKLARAKLVRVKYAQLDRLKNDLLKSESMKRLLAAEFLTDAEYHNLLDLINKLWTVQRFLQSKSKYDSGWLQLRLPQLIPFLILNGF